MFKTLSLTVFFVGILVAAQPVRASDFSHALQRMDEIIQQMQELKAEFESIAQTLGRTPTPAVLGSVDAKTLTEDLRFGATNDDIKRIQKLLATDSTIYPYGVASGYFGPKTQEAIRLFQSRFGLDTVGVIGPETRALLEVFLAAYPDGNYPDDALKNGRPDPAPVASSVRVVPQNSTVSSGTTPRTSVLKSINITEEDDEYIVKSYKSDGSRNRDLILYPKDEADLIQLIETKLKASESEVKALIAKTDFDFAKTVAPTADSATEETATVAIEDARVAVYAARKVIRNAELDGKNTSDADDLYTEARTLFTDARKALTKNDYLEAIDLAQNALDLANEAQDIL